MRSFINKSLIFIFLFLNPFFLNAIEISSIFPEEKIEWTFETTSGFQNLKNILVSKDGKTEETVSQLLNIKGILFNSYHNKIQRIKSQLNLGFSQKSRFLWTELPDFVHENNLSRHLRCIEFDTQVVFPIRFRYSYSLSPFLGYSFFNYSYEENFSGIGSTTYKYNSLVAGLRFQFLLTKAFKHNYYISYAPIVFENNRKSDIQFLNYGFEVKTNTHPLSLTFFANLKNAFHQKRELIFNGMRYNFDTSEIGFALHLNLRD